MKRLRIVLALCGLALGIGGSTAFAQAQAKNVCTGGDITGTVNGNLTVSGDCTITGQSGPVTINGNVTVTNGAYLNAGFLDTVVTINGNVHVAKGGKFGLGCAYFYNDCGNHPGPGAPPWAGHAVVVNGNVVATQALTMYLDSATIHGNVVSNGGGDITMVDSEQSEGLVFAIKDDVVDGNVVVHGWQGAWFGVIRVTVGGNVIVSDNVGTRVGDGDLPDSNEVATNVISGNLICVHNSPAAQIGDSGGSPNTVGGNKIGECAAPGL